MSTTTAASTASSTPLWDRPVALPPTGRKSNFENPESTAGGLLAINIVFLTLAVVVVSMRVAAQAIRSRPGDRFGVDGYMCLIATAGSIVHTALTIRSLELGLGRHLWDIRLVTMTHKNILIQTLLYPSYIVSLTFAKFSVLFLYLRFFKIIDFTRRLIWIGLFVTAVSSLGFLGLAISECVICSHIEAFAKPFCAKTSQHIVVQAAFNVAIDFYVFIIPMQQVYRLNMTSRQKWGVATIFGLGLLACIVSTVRLGWVTRNLHEADFFWASGLTSEMTVVEINATIMAPCLIFLPALAKSLFGWRSQSSPSYDSAQAKASHSHADRGRDSYVRMGDGDEGSIKLKVLSSTVDKRSARDTG